MKANLKLLLTFFFSLNVLLLTAAPVNISDALKKNMIKLNMNGAGSTHPAYLSSHYGKCILMKLKNLSSRRLELTLPAGYILLASDSSTQDMLLTEDIFVKLDPGKEKRMYIYAMCSEKNNGGPGEKTTFRIGGPGKGHLKEIASIIFKRKIQNNTGQQAVWCLTDRNPISAIDGDTADTRILREFVSKVTGQKMPTRTVRRVVPRPAPKATYKVTGMFDFTIHEPWSKVTIRLKDSSGAIIRTWVDDVSYRKGHYVETYEFSGNTLEAGTYFIEVLVDNVATMNRKLKIAAD